MWGRRFFGDPYYGPRYWGKGSVALTTVPDVAGQTETDGTTALQGAGFLVAVVEEYSSTVPAGFIISQVPAGGSQALPGSTVTIIVSLGERSSGAGKSKKRKRLYVEIDGQLFEVGDQQHAQALLDRAKEVARSHAETLAKEIIPSTSRINAKPVKLPTPAIRSPNPELREVITSARKAINEVYRQTSIDIELALLLARKLAEEEEEEALLLLI